MLAEIRGNQAKGSSPIGAPAFIEYPLLLVQLCIFAILYAIWVLPGTIALRNVCLVLGAILSLYPIFRARKLLLQKSAIPIWLVIALFGWVIFHLLFLSQEPVLQYEEFTSIWKRAAIGVIFAFGMGLSIAQMSNAAKSSGQSKCRTNLYWVIFYAGILAPTLIYIIKIFLVLYGQKLGLDAPSAIQIYIGSNASYIPKTAYVAFCLPLFAVTLGGILHNISNNHWFAWGNLTYLAATPAVFTIFYFENIKNGAAYGLILILIFFCAFIPSLFRGCMLPKIALAFIILGASWFFLTLHIQQNDSWKTIGADVKVALNTNQNQHWKSVGGNGYPVNGRGELIASPSTYYRVAWAKEGVRLILKNPFGYGLVEQSFGRLAKLRWPESELGQSHSGWIDLTLGIGIPGVTLLLSALILLILQLGDAYNPDFVISSWVIACRWTLLCLLLIWCTTEISQKVYLDSLIFLVALASGINLGLVREKFGLQTIT